MIASFRLLYRAWKSDLALLFVVLVWGINFPILKMALDVMPVFVVNALRFVVSTAVLGAIYYGRQRKTHDFFAPLRQHPYQIFGLGMLGYFFYQLFFITGLDQTTSGSAALIMASSPLWTGLISHALKYDYLRMFAWVALVISAVGTAVVVVAGPQTVDVGGGTLYGNLLMLGAAVGWGVYTALNKPLLNYVSPTGLTFFGLLLALPFLLAVAVPSLDQVAWAQVDAGVWLAILFSGGLSTGLAYAIWNTAVRNVGPSQTAVYGNLVPFVALLTGYLFLSEAITLPQVMGGLLIIGGVMLMRITRRRRVPVE